MVVVSRPRRVLRLPGLDARENQLDDHKRELTSPGSQPGDREHDRGVTKGTSGYVTTARFNAGLVRGTYLKDDPLSSRDTHGPPCSLALITDFGIN